MEQIRHELSILRIKIRLPVGASHSLASDQAQDILLILSPSLADFHVSTRDSRIFSPIRDSTLQHYSVLCQVLRP